MLQGELQNLKHRESDMRSENEKQYNEINVMRNRITELETGLKNSEVKSANLQLAVSNNACSFVSKSSAYFACCRQIESFSNALHFYP